ncbi:hypothetical protein DM01DRAFT_1230323 [Hesseltinella vesiculosa]|uniref:Transmembrane protein n=1 Tax=Hesseltinella vesiculosa TaxID=101127 RepID=A0A1X2GN65_9FUNG|nr:hypothetical protein DM01DRAFT_1230323 [Hesseltinella vesiculosa]
MLNMKSVGKCNGSSLKSLGTVLYRYHALITTSRLPHVCTYAKRRCHTYKSFATAFKFTVPVLRIDNALSFGVSFFSLPSLYLFPSLPLSSLLFFLLLFSSLSFFFFSSSARILKPLAYSGNSIC